MKIRLNPDIVIPQESKWVEGKPCFSGWYLLQFASGDQFVVIHAFFDDENIYRMEDQNNFGYVNDIVDPIIRFLPIIPPPNKRTSIE